MDFFFFTGSSSNKTGSSSFCKGLSRTNNGRPEEDLVSVYPFFSFSRFSQSLNFNNWWNEDSYLNRSRNHPCRPQLIWVHRRHRYFSKVYKSLRNNNWWNKPICSWYLQSLDSQDSYLNRSRNHPCRRQLIWVHRRHRYFSKVLFSYGNNNWWNESICRRF